MILPYRLAYFIIHLLQFGHLYLDSKFLKNHCKCTMINGAMKFYGKHDRTPNYEKPVLFTYMYVLSLNLP